MTRHLSSLLVPDSIRRSSVAAGSSRRPGWRRSLGCGLLLCLPGLGGFGLGGAERPFSPWGPLPLAAQVGSGSEVLDEIRSLEVRGEVSGGEGVSPSLARELEALVVRELERTGILRELPPPRGGACCVLRIDTRLGSPRGALRLGTGYTVRLDMGVYERFGRHEGWVLLWQSRTLGGVVDARELPEVLRAQVRELAIEFTDRYLERFPPR